MPDAVTEKLLKCDCARPLTGQLSSEARLYRSSPMSSQRWSCSSLADGYQDVMGDTLDGEEQMRQQQIEDRSKSC